MAGYIQTLATGAATTGGGVAAATVGAGVSSTAGSTLVAITHAAQNGASTIVSVFDSQSNTWRQDAHLTGRDPNIGVWTLANAPAFAAGDTISADWTSTSAGPSVAVYEFNGYGGVNDGAVSGIASATSAYNSTAGTVPAGAHLLIGVVGIAASTGTATPTGSGTWTALTNPPAGTGFGRAGRFFYQTVSGGGTLQHVGTLSTTLGNLAGALSYPAAAQDATIVGVLATAAAVAPAGTADVTSAGVAFQVRLPQNRARFRAASW